MDTDQEEQTKEKEEVSDTAKIMSLMSRPDVRLVKCEIVERVRPFGLGATSFYHKTGRVDLPRMVWLNLKRGTKVWVMGTNPEKGVILAEMLFFPETQRCLDLTQRNRLLILSTVGLLLAGLVFSETLCRSSGHSIVCGVVISMNTASRFSQLV